MEATGQLPGRVDGSLLGVAALAGSLAQEPAKAATPRIAQRPSWFTTCLMYLLFVLCCFVLYAKKLIRPRKAQQWRVYSNSRTSPKCIRAVCCRNPLRRH